MSEIFNKFEKEELMKNLQDSHVLNDDSSESLQKGSEKTEELLQAQEIIQEKPDFKRDSIEKKEDSFEKFEVFFSIMNSFEKIRYFYLISRF